MALDLKTLCAAWGERNLEYLFSYKYRMIGGKQNPNATLLIF